MMFIYIIIPAYNEETTISKVIVGIKQVAPLSNIIVVDDGSQDQTAHKARQAGAIVLCHIINRGQGAALSTGTSYALKQSADIIVHFDADGQHRPEDIDVLIEPIIKKEAEVVLGSRFLSVQSSARQDGLPEVQAGGQEIKVESGNCKIPFVKKIIGYLARWHTKIFIGLKVSDAHCGLRVFSRQAAEKIKITQDKMAHASEILSEIKQHNLSYKEIPVSVIYSDYSLKKGQKNFVGSLQILYDFLLNHKS